jgi:rod shape determining protein RodA
MELLSKRILSSVVDWPLFFAALTLSLLGLVTMHSFSGENYFATRQVVWLAFGVAVFFVASVIDWRFLRRSGILISLFLILSGILLLLIVFGERVNGVRSWLAVGTIFLQPADFMKLVLILILAKYFFRRHVEIRHIPHIIISALYAFIPFALVFFQPDFGSAVILFFIWLGMIMVSGVSKKHLLAVFFLGLVAFVALWLFVFKDYQKQRIVTFVHPLADIRGAGYNAFQSEIAVGSGRLLGKGVGYGTQSRLQFLPAYETDFIFAAFAEEWGFIGILIVFGLFGFVIWRVLMGALVGASNFERLFGLGLAIFLMSHFIINAGMNVGLLPITGITLPFMSYGGSHILCEFLGLGMLMGMRRYALPVHPEDGVNEFLGV